MISDNTNSHSYFMLEALKEAKKAFALGEVPIGAIIVQKGNIIATGYNKTEHLQQCCAHAEIEAITNACNVIGSRRLSDVVLYVTLEPCSMCAGAIILARIPTVVYAAKDPKSGAVDSLYQILQDKRLNHRCEVISGIFADKSEQLLSTFFKGLRSGEIAKSSFHNVL